MRGECSESRTKCRFVSVTTVFYRPHCNVADKLRLNISIPTIKSTHLFISALLRMMMWFSVFRSRKCLPFIWINKNTKSINDHSFPPLTPYLNVLHHTQITMTYVVLAALFLGEGNGCESSGDKPPTLTTETRLPQYEVTRSKGSGQNYYTPTGRTKTQKMMVVSARTPFP